MVIAFDLDDVLAAYQLGWIAFNNEKYGHNLTFEDIKDYSYRDSMNISDDEVFRRIYEIYASNIIRELAPVPGAIDVINRLSGDGHSLYILTSRPTQIKEVTRNWIDEHFPQQFIDILFSGQVSQKGYDHKITKADICKEYRVDWLVEDAPMHAEHAAQAGINVAVVEKPWNRNVTFTNSLIKRIGDVSELPDLIQK